LTCWTIRGYFNDQLGQTNIETEMDSFDLMRFLLTFL